MLSANYNYSISKVCVLGLAGMDLTFPTAAYIVLCSALLARTTLILLPISEQCWHSIEAVTPTPRPKRPVGWGGQEVWRSTARTADLKGYSMPYNVMFSNKIRGGRKRKVEFSL